MLHVWTTTDNPDGVFAPDNWALAFTRLGLAIPQAMPGAAARAVSLASGGSRFFADVINAATESSQSRLVQKALTEAEQSVRAVLFRRADRIELDAAELDELSGIWQALWRSVDAAFPPDIRAHLQHLRSAKS